MVEIFFLIKVLNDRLKPEEGGGTQGVLGQMYEFTGILQPYGY